MLKRSDVFVDSVSKHLESQPLHSLPAMHCSNHGYQSACKARQSCAAYLVQLGAGQQVKVFWVLLLQ